MQRWFILILLAAISFIPALGYYMVGEEGYYTISSMEMWFNQNWLIQTTFGGSLSRPPLMNWLVMPVAELIGWPHVLVATRLVSIAATLGTAAWLYWLCSKLFKEKEFALFATLAYLAMADLLIYRGWLAYTDPTFTFFTFGAMAALWVAVIEQNKRWLLLSILLVSCALLAKAFTAYVFYGTVAFVLLWQRPHRRFMLSPASLPIFALALIIPFAWFASLPPVEGQGTSMLNEILFKLTAIQSPDYLSYIAIFPFDTAIRLSPVVLLAVYLLLRKRVSQADSMRLHFKDAALIAGLCFLPYWLSPLSSIRYLMPAYPLIALVGARIIWRSGASARTLAFRWFAGVIAFKFIFALILAPYYQSHYRGENYADTAREIIRRSAGFPIYVNNFRSIELNIVNYIDIERWPSAPMTYPPKEWNNGFVLAMSADEAIGKTAEIYTVAGDKTYLLCRGLACQAAADKNTGE